MKSHFVMTLESQYILWKYFEEIQCLLGVIQYMLTTLVGYQKTIVVLELEKILVVIKLDVIVKNVLAECDSVGIGHCFLYLGICMINKPVKRT